MDTTRKNNFVWGNPEPESQIWYNFIYKCILSLKKEIIKQQSIDPEQSGKEGCSRVHSGTFLPEKGKKNQFCMCIVWGRKWEWSGERGSEWMRKCMKRQLELGSDRDVWKRGSGISLESVRMILVSTASKGGCPVWIDHLLQSGKVFIGGTSLHSIRVLA